MEIRFEDFGVLEYIEAEEFYRINASLYGLARGDDGEMYDIILITKADGSQKWACGNI